MSIASCSAIYKGRVTDGGVTQPARSLPRGRGDLIESAQGQNGVVATKTEGIAYRQIDLGFTRPDWG